MKTPAKVTAITFAGEEAEMHEVQGTAETEKQNTQAIAMI